MRILASRDHAHFGGDELCGLFQGRRHGYGYLTRTVFVMVDRLLVLCGDTVDEGSGDRVFCEVMVDAEDLVER